MNAELIAYYLNLLIIQYISRPKARETIELLIGSLMIYDLMESVNQGYDIDTGEGVQLDVLGKYLGTDRNITGIPFTRTYFGFIRFGDNPGLSIFGGFMRFGDTPPDEQFLRFGESEQSVLLLNDAEFRINLKFKAIQNFSDHSIADIDNLLFENFGDAVIMDDNFDMTMAYTFPTQDTRLAQILQAEDLLPRPAAVEVEIAFQ